MTTAAADFLFIEMDDDKKAHIRFCRDEAAVTAAVGASIFTDGSKSEDEREQVDDLAAALLEYGSHLFEGDPRLYLFRVGSVAAPQEARQESVAEILEWIVRRSTDASVTNMARRALELLPRAAPESQQDVLAAPSSAPAVALSSSNARDVAAELFLNQPAPAPIEQQAALASDVDVITGELVELGLDESGIASLAIVSGTRTVNVSGMTLDESKRLARALFQRVFLTISPVDRSADAGCQPAPDALVAEQHDDGGAGDARAVIEEMIAVATTDGDEWPIDNRAQVDKWQARLQVALALAANEQQGDGEVASASSVTPTLWESFEMGFGLRSAMLGHVFDGRDVGRLTTCEFWHPALSDMHKSTELHAGLSVGEAVAKLKHEAKRRLGAMQPSARVALSDEALECLRDVVSHHDNIAAGFAAQRKAALDAGDTDSVAYWNHELDVAHRMKEQAERAILAAHAAQTGESEC